jgi:MFS family permease
MGTLRLIVGFMTFLVAFGFRNDHAPAWWYGVVLAVSIGGNLVGAAVAPWLRSRLREELILAVSTAAVSVAGIVALFFNAVHSRPAAAMLAAIVGLSAGAAKLSFDALVQRHIPATSQGRAFGRFEDGFQLVWVVGGLIPVVIEMSLPVGFVIITVAAAFAALVYVVGTRMARQARLPAWWPGVRSPSPARRAPKRPASDDATVPVNGPPFVPFVRDGPTVPFDQGENRGPPESAPPYDDMPWMSPPPELGTYPPVIEGPPPLGRGGRPTPPPLAGPPPIAAPLAPRPRRDPPPE